MKSLEAREGYVSPYWRARHGYGLARCAAKLGENRTAEALAREALTGAEQLGIRSLADGIRNLLGRLSGRPPEGSSPALPPEGHFL